MAIVRIPSEHITMTDTNALTSYLASRGIDYERWTLDVELPPDPTPESVLAAYAGRVESLKQRVPLWKKEVYEGGEAWVGRGS